MSPSVNRINHRPPKSALLVRVQSGTPFLFALLICFGGLHGTVHGMNGDEAKSIWLPLSEGVYWHKGQHRGVEEEGRDDIANSGLVIGDRCMAIIDAGGSTVVGQRLIAAARAISDRPLCYVISTHIHYDHVIGGASLVRDQTRYVGHHLLPGALAGSADFFRQHFAAELADVALPEVDIVVEGERTLDLGGRSLQLRSWPAAHTRSDMTVRDSVSGVLWTGDLLFRERLPVLDGSLRGWLAVMRDLQTIPASRIVPGHGAISDSWKQALTAQADYLSWLLDAVRKMIAEGVFMEDAIDDLEPSNKDQWLFYRPSTQRANVSRAFTELEWE